MAQSDAGSDAIWVGIDLGTQSVRAVAVDPTGEILSAAARPLTSHRDGDRHAESLPTRGVHRAADPRGRQQLVETVLCGGPLVRRRDAAKPSVAVASSTR